MFQKMKGVFRNTKKPNIHLLFSKSMVSRSYGKHGFTGIGKLGYFISLLCTAILLTSCAATVESTDCGVKWMEPTKRVTPPSAGNNRVWVDFQDQVGEGIDIRDQLIDGLSTRGYQLETDFAKADYILWVSLRYFDEVDEKGGGMSKARSFGGFGRPRVRASRYHEAPVLVVNNYEPSPCSKPITTSLYDRIIEWLFMKKEYALILEIQLGEKVEEEVQEEIVEERNQDSRATQAENMGGGGYLSSKTDDHHKRTQKVKRKKVHLQMENRLIMSVRGTRLAKSVAAEAISLKLSKALKDILPRAS